MNNKWAVSGNQYQQREVSQQVTNLPPGIYMVEYNEQFAMHYLVNTSDRFILPPKLYGHDKDFATRFLKTYWNTTGNLGTLFNGVKGTGKTVTAQIICNELKLPVLVVSRRYDTLPVFLNSIQQEVVVMIDEYDKIYNQYDNSILTVMDGVLSSEHRRVFLLTSNDNYLSASMTQRPSRIRYIKTFGDLDRATIEEIVDDLLVHKHHREATIKYMSTLETITIDIAKCMVNEVNIHDEAPGVFGDIFNTKVSENNFSIWKLSSGEGGHVKETLWLPAARVEPIKITPESTGQTLMINGGWAGQIKQVLGDVVTYEDDDNETRSVRIEKQDYMHKSFAI